MKRNTRGACTRGKVVLADQHLQGARKSSHAGRNSKCQAQSGSISSNHQANWASLRSIEYHKHRKLERAQWRKFEKAKAKAAKDTKEEEENKCRSWYALHQPHRDAHRWELAAATARSSASSATART